MSDLQTPRLTLRLMPAAAIAAAMAKDYSLAGALLGAIVPPELLDRPEGLHRALTLLEEDPAYQPWSLRAVILDGAMVGHVRFHSLPDPAYLRPFARGAVEFGYTIFTPHRRQGLATEAVEAAMAWAHKTFGVRKFVLSITPDNLASQALAARLGFIRIGEWEDEVDGTEHVLLREVQAAAT